MYVAQRCTRLIDPSPSSPPEGLNDSRTWKGARRRSHNYLPCLPTTVWPVLSSTFAGHSDNILRIPAINNKKTKCEPHLIIKA